MNINCSVGSAVCLMYVSPLMLPSYEWRIHEAWGYMGACVFTFGYACKCVSCDAHAHLFRVRWVALMPPKLWHSTYNPLLLCCLTLYNLWPVSAWTFLPFSTEAVSRRSDLHVSSWAHEDRHEVFKSVSRKRFAGLYQHTVYIENHMSCGDHFNLNSYIKAWSHIFYINAAC